MHGFFLALQHRQLLLHFMHLLLQSNIHHVVPPRGDAARLRALQRILAVLLLVGPGAIRPGPARTLHKEEHASRFVFGLHARPFFLAERWALLARLRLLAVLSNIFIFHFSRK